MKKWTKRLLKIAVIFGLLLILADLGVHLMARTEWFNAQVERVLQNALGRRVIIGPLAANLSGVSVHDIHIAEAGGFDKGTFLQADRLRLRWSLWHLLHAHIKIKRLMLSDVVARVKVYKDGTTSWADFTTPQLTAQPVEEKPTSVPSFELTANRVRLENLHLHYEDEQTPRTLDISGLTLNVKDFSLQDEFSLQLLAKFQHQEFGFEGILPLTLKARVKLANLDWPHTYVHLEALKAYYQHATVTLSGRVQHFKNPRGEAKLVVRNLSSSMLPASVAKKIEFTLPRADLSAAFSVDLAKQIFTLTNSTLQFPGVDMQVDGTVQYANRLVPQLSAQVNLVLGEIGRWFTSLADPYRFVGTIHGEVSSTAQEAHAQVTFSEIGALIPHAGRVANVNGQIDVTESMNFKNGQADIKVEGKLNADPFKLSLQATQTPQKITSHLDVYAKELIWPALQKATTSPSAGGDTSGAAQKPWPLPPVDLTAYVKLDSVDVPYFKGKDILFTSQIEGLTPQLDQAHGVLRLTTGTGTIQDIYKLTDANALTKVLFLSLNVTGKVFNSLNVVGVLSSLGGGVVSAVSGGEKEEPVPVKTQTILGPDGEPLEVEVPVQEKEVSGEMAYDKFDTEVNFVRGLATIKEGTFVSPTMSFRLDGTADFNSGKLDMDVHAAPGRHEVDGVMPLHLHIGGTVEDPQGDMQLLGSVTSLITQSVTNNVVSRQVKKGFKGLFGLFSKDKED